MFPGRAALLLAVALALAPGCKVAVSGSSGDGAGVLLTTLAVLKGRVEVQSFGADAFSPARSGQALVTGDRIRTGQDGMAVITFFDGSTMSLDTQTAVTLYQQRMGGDDPREVRIVVRQMAGTTWIRGDPLPEAPYRLQVMLPGATVSVAESATLEIETPATGPALVRSVRGTISVGGDGDQQQVGAGQEIAVPAGGKPEGPTDTPQPVHRLALHLEAPALAWLRIVDSAGRSAGAVAPGLPVDQLPGALVRGPFWQSSEVLLTRVRPGRYTVVLDPTDDGLFALGVTAWADGQRLANEVRRGLMQRGRLVAATLEVKGKEDQPESALLGMFAPVQGVGPGMVVRSAFALETIGRRKAAAPATGPNGADASSSTATASPPPAETATATATATASPTNTSTRTPTRTPPTATPSPRPPTQAPPAATATSRPRPSATPLPAATSSPPPPPPPATATRPPATSTATPASPQGGAAP